MGHHSPQGFWSLWFFAIWGNATLLPQLKIKADLKLQLLATKILLKTTLG